MFDQKELVGTSRETAIEDAVIANVGQLGYPGALAIRRCRVAKPCGLVDLMLLPTCGTTKLVLVEAKASSAPDAAAKVIGQLLMYYAGALMLGQRGLGLLRDFAATHRDKAIRLSKISPAAVTGLRGAGGDPAWRAMYEGEPLRPEHIAMIVALDGEPHRAFQPTLRALKVHHGLSITYCIARNGQVEVRTV